MGHSELWARTHGYIVGCLKPCRCHNSESQYPFTSDILRLKCRWVCAVVLRHAKIWCNIEYSNVVTKIEHRTNFELPNKSGMLFLFLLYQPLGNPFTLYRLGRMYANALGLSLCKVMVILSLFFLPHMYPCLYILLIPNAFMTPLDLFHDGFRLFGAEPLSKPKVMFYES